MSVKRKLLDEFFTPAKSAKSAVQAAPETNRARSSDSGAVNSGRKPILVVLPGASGALSKSMATIMMPKLSKHFTVVVREGKWRGWNPNSDENVASILNVCPRDGSDYFILGNSFGNRVLCSLFVNDHFAGRNVPSPRGVIMCGYPMYGEKYTNERVSLFQSLPSGVRVCCISGSNDEFLNRTPASVKDSKAILKGESLFQFIIKTMDGAGPEPELHIVPGGGHGVIDVPKSKQEGVVTRVLGIINKFAAK